MRDLVDTVFGPSIGWLTAIYDKLSSLSIPLSRPLDLSNYFGYFKIMGPTWTSCITTTIALSVIYLIAYVIVSNIGLLIKFKDTVKWW